MTADEKLQDVEKLLRKHSQSHLLAFWENLGLGQRRDLLACLHGLDWPKIDDWVANYVKKAPPVAVPAELAPPEFYAAEPVNARQQERRAKARKLGRELISAGKVAAFVVAGGQGTRLGFPGPKGDLSISPVKNKPLFRIFARQSPPSRKNTKRRAPGTS